MAIELVQEIDRRTSHHPGHQKNRLSVSTPVHSSAAGECGLLPQHNEHRIRSRCSRYLTFCLVFTPKTKQIIIIIITSCRRAAATICPAHLPPVGAEAPSAAKQTATWQQFPTANTFPRPPLQPPDAPTRR